MEDKYKIISICKNYYTYTLSCDCWLNKDIGYNIMIYYIAILPFIESM